MKLLCITIQVTDIVSDATFILLVEKDAAFMRLAEDRFYNAYPCIILTAKGQPDVATRCVQGMQACMARTGVYVDYCGETPPPSTCPKHVSGICHRDLPHKEHMFVSRQPHIPMLPHSTACMRVYVPAPLACPYSLFLKRLKAVLKLPVLALVDSDPYGLKILSVYMKVCAGCGERRPGVCCVMYS